MDNVPVDTLLHIADIHFWKVVLNPLRLLNKRFLGNLNIILRRGAEFPMAHAKSCLDALIHMESRQALFTGDFTSTAVDEEFKLARDFLHELGSHDFAIHVVPGNHDVYTFESLRNRRFERYLGEFLPLGAKPVLRHLKGGTPLLLVPTVCPNMISSKGHISEDTIARVGELLGSCDGRIVVAGHYPVLWQTNSYYTKRDRRLRNADRLRTLLGSSGKQILYVAGHVHRFSYSFDPEYPNLEHVTTGALFRIDKRRGIKGEFSEIRIDTDGFRVSHHVWTDRWEARVSEPEHIPSP